ncbi:hypothetical protein C100_04350 [Sphingobium sp. C100]|uniref:hypothetical protein n=1 Tax=Sphingobium sp. C100 TaxID=1207055 RepID=UPI0003D5FAEB|nr:hypothetical protein [Sphingobium sp. C100]ETI64971.1 hypothetical protein C100_04350 [Sphingobium sp. C100]
MSGDAPARGFAARPRDPDSWVRSPERRTGRGEHYSARLTIDVTPALRGRIKVAAFQRGQTVADLLRAMLEDAFPEDRA